MKTRAIKHKILQVIKTSGPCTQKELANLLNLHVTTLSKAIYELLKEDHLISEIGKDKSSGGRKSRLYQLNNKIGYIAGIDIGGENTRVLIMDIFGKILKEKRQKTPQEGAEQVYAQTLDLLYRTFEPLPQSLEGILGIGVGISGCIDTRHHKISFCPNIKGLEEFPFKEKLEKEIQKTVLIDDSVRCMALAEKKYGSAEDLSNFIFVSIGSGVGAGIFINDHIYKGSEKSRGFTGEIGHITVSETGPMCKCGNKGCLEALASGPSIIQRALDGLNKRIMTSLQKYNDGGGKHLTVESIMKEAREGDKFAYYLIQRTGEYIGIAIADALNFLGSDQVIIGGGVSNCGDILMDAIKRTVQIRALSVISKNTQIVSSSLGDYSAALGAGANFIDYFFSENNQKLLKQTHDHEAIS